MVENMNENTTRKMRITYPFKLLNKYHQTILTSGELTTDNTKKEFDI